ncbi:MAG TPA: hypothetical protein VJJ52_00100 [Candidatus Nanoarchaeia archaeon]|nr:hypothetical protein [Candidatus Nanoarchaeia archaeon]
MKHRKIVDIVSTLVLGIGMLIAFSSHAFHSKIGFGEETSHIAHVVYGMITAIIGLGILIWNNKALKFQK